jgi:hypothetical protein
MDTPTPSGNVMKSAIESMLFDTVMSIVRDVKKTGKMNLDVMEYLKRVVEIQSMMNKMKEEMPTDSAFNGLDVDELISKAKSGK